MRLRFRDNNHNNSTRLFTFAGGTSGQWRVERVLPVTGATLDATSHVAVVAGPFLQPTASASWLLRGITSNERYVIREEKARLVGRQEGLGRAAATFAALIPIRKSPAWWTLTQDERRELFETASRHIAIGLQYLPAVARRLHHCRDLGPNEAFDFLTWFEYAPSDEPAFESLLEKLRASPEWTYVGREVDIRLVREDA